MSKLLLIVLILASIVFWWHWQNTPDPEQKKKLLQKTIIGALIIGTILLVLTGRMHWVGAVLAGLLAFIRQWSGILLRYYPMLIQLYRSHAPSARAPNTSTVSTKIIRMDLNHDTGKLSGLVLGGEFKGKALDDLNRQQLSTLFEYCQQHDADSARLLESYLVARFGAEADEASTAQGRAAVPSGKMTPAEALQVLGLAGSPSKDEINKAYRRIMQQLHPDRGGSEYFATKANQAREVLIHRLEREN